MKDRVSRGVRRSSRRVVRAAFAAAAVALGFGSARADAVPASAYVQDGLIVQWDGIENAGRSAGKVVDLVGGYEIVLGSGESAASNSFFLNDQHLVRGAFAAKNSENPPHMTIEVRAKPSDMTRDSEMPVVEAAGRNAICFDKRESEKRAGMCLYCKQTESAGLADRYYYRVTSHPLGNWEAICAPEAKAFSYAVLLAARRPRLGLTSTVRATPFRLRAARSGTAIGCPVRTKSRLAAAMPPRRTTRSASTTAS